MREEIRTVFKKVMKGGLRSDEYFENPVLTKTGEERVILWHNILLKNELGEVYSCLSSGLDITEKLQLEHQIRRAEKLAAVGQLVSGLAHEIGTPLGVIGGRAEYMLRKIPQEDPIRENLTRIITQIDRITKIVNQLLSFARKKPPEVRSVRLVPILQDVLSLLEHQTQKQGISISLDFFETLPEALVDPDQIQQVFLNLILNAIQSMPQGGSLKVRLSQTIPRRDREDPLQDHYLKIQFSDTGFGIPEENLNRIFDPFFTTKDVGKGTGLGLTTSFNIVKNHGGWIDVRSRIQEGSIFCIYLPFDSSQGEPVHG
jgi:signal transduction histidine kinase